MLNKNRGLANRATFVIDENGKVTSIEISGSAINVSGALSPCSK
ncbi:MAG: hypothetical protein ABSH28_03700 [Acidobacteriota bacterium]